jgi:hypothetical protein
MISPVYPFLLKLIRPARQLTLAVDAARALSGDCGAQQQQEDNSNTHGDLLLIHLWTGTQQPDWIAVEDVYGAPL